MYRNPCRRLTVFADAQYLPLITDPKHFTELLFFICGIEVQNLISPDTYQGSNNEILLTLLGQSGILPNVAFSDFDMNALDEQTRLFNVFSRARARHLLDFFFSTLILTDQEGNVQDGRQFLFDPMFGWFLVSLEHHFHLAFATSPSNDFDRQLAWILASFPSVQPYYNTFICKYPLQDNSRPTNMLWPDLPKFSLSWRFEQIPSAPGKIGPLLSFGC